MSSYGNNANITGNLNIGTLQLIGGAITDSSGSISFGSNNVSTTGNVGIGTNNPLEKLDVNGGFLRVRDATSTTIGNSIFRSDSLELGMNRSADGLSYIDFHGSVGSDYDFRCIRGSGTNEAIQFINAGTGNMVFATNSTNAMIIDGTGNVGIGITTPLTKLEISGDASEYIKVYNQGTAGDRAGLIMCNDSANNLAGGDTPQWAGFIDWKVGNDDLFIGHYRNYVRNEYITLDSSGNVGIGTTNPQDTLHLSANGTATVLMLENTETGANKWGFHSMGSVRTGRLEIQSQGGTDTIPFTIEKSCPSHTLYLNSSGNVGIGKTDPQVKLDVVGDIKCDNILSGTYTATGANITGITAIGIYTAQYMRVGNVVSVSGAVDITANSGTKQFTLTLPISSTNGGQENCAGQLTGNGGLVIGTGIGGTADKITFYIGVPTGSFSATGCFYTYTYLIN